MNLARHEILLSLLSVAGDDEGRACALSSSLSRRLDVGREENGKKEGARIDEDEGEGHHRSFGMGCFGSRTENLRVEVAVAGGEEEKREREGRGINVGKGVEGAKRTMRLGREGGWRRGGKRSI